MKKKRTQLTDLAAIDALGALESGDAAELAALLSQSEEARREVDAFGKVAEALARSLPAATPPPHLKDQILRHAVQSQTRRQAAEAIQRLVPPSQAGLSFVRQPGEAGWVPLPVPGAFVKVLSYDSASRHAIVLGKLDPGARYPAHTHKHPEDIYMLSGDLHIGDHVLEAGDFHHADAGSRHGVNWSNGGCVLLAILSKEDLLAQLVPSA